MMWRTDRGLREPTPAAFMWMWSAPTGSRSEDAEASNEVAGRPRQMEPDPEPIARRLAARAGDALFDPVEFALVGGWAFLTGISSRSTH